MTPDPQPKKAERTAHPPTTGFRRGLAAVIVGTATVMLAFEAVKQVLYPDITLWNSHRATIVFATFLAALAAYYVGSHLAALNERLEALVSQVNRELLQLEMSEAALRQSEEKFAKAFRASPDCIVIAAVDEGGVVEVNEQFERITGYSRSDLLGRTATDLGMFVNPREREEMKALLRTSGAIRDYEYAFRRKSGQVGTMLMSGELIELGGRQCALSVHRDITFQKLAQEALRASEEKFAKAFQASPDCIVIAPLEGGGVMEVNDRFEEITGYSRSEILGRSASDLGLFVDPSVREQMAATLKAGGRVRDLEYELRRKSGEIAAMQVSVDVIDVGGVTCALSVHRDITARKHLEAQLRQAQKMEAVGRLAAGIAHDFNNLLTVILWSCEMGIPRLAPGDPQRVALIDIQSAANRAASLTQQLLAFSRQQLVQPSILDLNQVLAELQRMLARLIGEDITLEFAPAADLNPVRIDVGQVQQIVVNLAANARDAMPRGGKLLLETRNVRVDQKYVERHREMPPGDYVLLAMTDTGAGMDPATQARLFEPFFTTKEVGKGTGLGLATVYGIVKQNEGFIWVYSEPGRGTTFKVYFPRSDAPQAPARLETVAATTADGQETVLLVEDEDALRNLLGKHLAGLGYRVISAHSGLEALEKWGSDGKPPALLVTDVVMPGMSGRELADQLLTRLPDLKVLYISGYTDEAVLRHGILPSGSFFLQKPFALHLFAKKVRDILDAR